MSRVVFSLNPLTIFFDDSNGASSIMMRLMGSIDVDDRIFCDCELSCGVKLAVGWSVVLSLPLPLFIAVSGIHS